MQCLRSLHVLAAPEARNAVPEGAIVQGSVFETGLGGTVWAPVREGVLPQESRIVGIPDRRYEAVAPCIPLFPSDEGEQDGNAGAGENAHEQA
jgi:hypothetical protein